MSDSSNRVQIVFLSQMNVRSTRQFPASFSSTPRSELLVSVDQPSHDDIVGEMRSASTRSEFRDDATRFEQLFTFRSSVL